MKKIIATVGLIGSGKDYRAQEFVNQGYKHINFATPMKRIVEKLFGFTENELNDTILYEKFKQSIIDLRIPHVVHNHHSKEEWKDLNGRQFLQRLGTEVGRDMFGKNFWVDQWDKAHSGYINVVVTDCRFENEIKAILNYDVTFIHCAYESEKYLQTIANGNTNHESEKLAWELHNLGFKDGEDITEYMRKTYG